MEREGEEEASSGRKARKKTEEGTGEERNTEQEAYKQNKKVGEKTEWKLFQII